MAEQTPGNVPVEGVAVTAIGVAVIRARETARTDRLYVDPLAQAFVDAARTAFSTQRWVELTALADDFYEGRTVGVRFVDDRVREARDTGIRQKPSVPGVSAASGRRNRLSRSGKRTGCPGLRCRAVASGTRLGHRVP